MRVGIGRSATPVQSVLVGMMAAWRPLGGPVEPVGPDLTITNGTFYGSMFGVHVNCRVFELKPYRWADVALTGGVFGHRGVKGRAWYEFSDVRDPLHPRIKLDKRLERSLRRYRVELHDVQPTADNNPDSLTLHMSLPAIGHQRMMLWRAPEPRDRWCEL